MRKFYTLFLLLMAAAVNASAAWDGMTTEAFSKGEGTAENPYQIENEAQYVYFQRAVNGGESYEDKFFILTADLDFDNRNINPIGFHDDYSMDSQYYMESKFFLGTFDGNYKTIDNANVLLALPDEDEIGGVGLFAGGRSKTTVKNIIVGSRLKVIGTGTCDVGGIMGVSYGATIEKCSFAGTIDGGTTESGGIVGYAQGGNIRECIFSGNISANSFTGGIVGATETTSVANCLCTGTVNGNQGYWVAGIVAWANVNTTISNCLAVGLVQGVTGSAYIPGISPICAELENSTARNCFYVESLTGCKPLSAQAGVTAKTVEDATDATMARLLNGGMADGKWTAVEGQTPTLAWYATVSAGIDGVIAPHSVKIYAVGGTIAVEAEDAVMTVVDLAGRVVYTQEVKGCASYAPGASGIYVVAVRETNGASTTAKVAI